MPPLFDNVQLTGWFSAETRKKRKWSPTDDNSTRCIYFHLSAGSKGRYSFDFRERLERLDGAVEGVEAMERGERQRVELAALEGLDVGVGMGGGGPDRLSRPSSTHLRSPPVRTMTLSTPFSNMILAVPVAIFSSKSYNSNHTPSLLRAS